MHLSHGPPIHHLPHTEFDVNTNNGTPFRRYRVQNEGKMESDGPLHFLVSILNQLQDGIDACAQEQMVFFIKITMNIPAIRVTSEPPTVPNVVSIAVTFRFLHTGARVHNHLYCLHQREILLEVWLSFLRPCCQLRMRKGLANAALYCNDLIGHSTECRFQYKKHPLFPTGKPNPTIHLFLNLICDGRLGVYVSEDA